MKRLGMIIVLLGLSIPSISLLLEINYGEGEYLAASGLTLLFIGIGIFLYCKKGGIKMKKLLGMLLIGTMLLIISHTAANADANWKVYLCLGTFCNEESFFDSTNIPVWDRVKRTITFKHEGKKIVIILGVEDTAVIKQLQGGIEWKKNTQKSYSN